MAALALLIGVAVLSYFAVAGAKRWALAYQIMDIPSARSSHTRPMPRAGGVGMVVPLCIAVAIVAAALGGITPAAWAVLGGGIAVAAVGLIDDLRRLPARARFSVHLLAAAVAVMAGARIPTHSGSMPLELAGGLLSVLWLVAVTNIFNFMDGIDGIAAGVAVLSGAGLALLGALWGQAAVMLLSVALAASALGFLAHNFPPASVFMGDVGSGFLGFMLAGLTLIAATSPPDGLSGIGAAFVLAPFLLDATLTLARRVIRGDRWYEAHRSHYYQRLVILGYSHRAVSFLYYALTTLAVLGALAYVTLPAPAGPVLLLVSIAPFFILPVAVPRWESRPAGPAPSHS